MVAPRYYLIIYRRSTGRLLHDTPTEHTEQAAALLRRLAEARFIADPDVEVVVLNGVSLEAIKRAHGRYFYTATELIARLADALAETPDGDAVWSEDVED